MALPPQLIRVKRKRDENAPVTFLQLESTPKRHRGNETAGWVYRRKTAESAQTLSQLEPPSQASRPVIQATQPGDERRIAPAKRRNQSEQSLNQGTEQSPSGPPPNGVASLEEPAGQKLAHTQLTAVPKPTKERSARATSSKDGDTTGDKTPERRRYHYSRAASTLPGRGSRIGSPGISKRDRYGAVFIEKRKSEGGSPRAKLLSNSFHGATTHTSGGKDQRAVTVQSNTDKSEEIPHSGSDAGLDSQDGGRRPFPPVNAATDNMAHVAATMNAWALEEIGANLDALDSTKPGATRKPSSRFRPKPPAKRWAERHPEQALKALGPSPVTDGAHPVEEDDKRSVNDDSDSDCVYDTYERVSIANMATQCNPNDVGVLVIDDEDDAERFYWPEQDSDDDEEDEEDENAEAYYTADYPEDELDSDDEHGLGAYNYRNGNASDEEEYLGADDDDADHDAEFAHEGDLDGEEVVMARVRRFNQHFNPGSSR